MLNSGDLPSGRIKAGITRATKVGLPGGAAPKMSLPAAPNIGMAKIPHDGDMADAPKLKPYTGAKKFLGSMKFGGKIKKTGLYLMHRDEEVHSPHNRRRLSR
jgi:hypothetical protein